VDVKINLIEIANFGRGFTFNWLHNDTLNQLEKNVNLLKANSVKKVKNTHTQQQKYLKNLKSIFKPEIFKNLKEFLNQKFKIILKAFLNQKFKIILKAFLNQKFKIILKEFLNQKFKKYFNNFL